MDNLLMLILGYMRTKFLTSRLWLMRHFDSIDLELVFDTIFTVHWCVYAIVYPQWQIETAVL